jgi:hypothetical protein
MSDGDLPTSNMFLHVRKPSMVTVEILRMETGVAYSSQCLRVIPRWMVRGMSFKKGPRRVCWARARLETGRNISP